MASNIIPQNSLRIVKNNPDDPTSKMVLSRMGMTMEQFMSAFGYHSQHSQANSLNRSESKMSFVWPKHTRLEIYDASESVYRYEPNDNSWCIRFRALGYYSFSADRQNDNITLTRPVPTQYPDALNNTFNSITDTDLSALKKARCFNEADQKILSETITSPERHKLLEDLQLSDSDEDGNTSVIQTVAPTTLSLLPTTASSESTGVTAALEENPNRSITESRLWIQRVPFISPLSVMSTCIQDHATCDSDSVISHPAQETAVIAQAYKSTEDDVPRQKPSAEDRASAQSQLPLAAKTIQPSSSSYALSWDDHQKTTVKGSGQLAVNAGSGDKAEKDGVMGDLFPPQGSPVAGRQIDPAYLCQNGKAGGHPSGALEHRQRQTRHDRKLYIDRLLDESSAFLELERVCFVRNLSPSPTSAPPTSNGALTDQHSSATLTTAALQPSDDEEVAPAQERPGPLPSAVAPAASDQHHQRVSAQSHSALSDHKSMVRSAPTPVSDLRASDYRPDEQPSRENSAPFSKEFHNQPETVPPSPTVHSSQPVTVSKSVTPLKAIKSVKSSSASKENHHELSVDTDTANGSARAYGQDKSTASGQASKKSAGTMGNPPEALNRDHFNALQHSADISEDIPAFSQPSVPHRQPPTAWVFSDLQLVKLRNQLHGLTKKLSHQTSSSRPPSNEMLSEVRYLLVACSRGCLPGDIGQRRGRRKALTGVLLFPSRSQCLEEQNTSVEQAVVPSLPRKTFRDTGTITSPSTNAAVVTARCSVGVQISPTPCRTVATATADLVDNHLYCQIERLESIATQGEKDLCRDSSLTDQLRLSDEYKSKAIASWRSVVAAVSCVLAGKTSTPPPPPAPSLATVGEVSGAVSSRRYHLLLGLPVLLQYPVELLSSLRHRLAAFTIRSVVGSDSGHGPAPVELLVETSRLADQLVHKLRRIESKLTQDKHRAFTADEKQAVSRDASWFRLWHYSLVKIKAWLTFREVRLKLAGLAKLDILETATSCSTAEDIKKETAGSLSGDLRPGQSLSNETQTSADRSDAKPSADWLMQLYQSLVNWEEADNLAAFVPSLLDREGSVPSTIASLSPASGGVFFRGIDTPPGAVLHFIDGLLRYHACLTEQLKQMSLLAASNKGDRVAKTEKDQSSSLIASQVNPVASSTAADASLLSDKRKRKARPSGVPVVTPAPSTASNSPSRHTSSLLTYGGETSECSPLGSSTSQRISIKSLEASSGAGLTGGSARRQSSGKTSGGGFRGEGANSNSQGHQAQHRTASLVSECSDSIPVPPILHIPNTRNELHFGGESSKASNGVITGLMGKEKQGSVKARHLGGSKPTSALALLKSEPTKERRPKTPKPVSSVPTSTMFKVASGHQESFSTPPERLKDDETGRKVKKPKPDHPLCEFQEAVASRLVSSPTWTSGSSTSLSAVVPQERQRKRSKSLAPMAAPAKRVAKYDAVAGRQMAKTRVSPVKDRPQAAAPSPQHWLHRQHYDPTAATTDWTEEHAYKPKRIRQSPINSDSSLASASPPIPSYRPSKLSLLPDKFTTADEKQKVFGGRRVRSSSVNRQSRPPTDSQTSVQKPGDPPPPPPLGTVRDRKRHSTPGPTPGYSPKKQQAILTNGSSGAGATGHRPPVYRVTAPAEPNPTSVPTSSTSVLPSFYSQRKSGPTGVPPGKSSFGSTAQPKDFVRRAGSQSHGRP